MALTLGERVKELRTIAGLSQVDLADRLQLSRQAVTKWESDRGIPDPENLQYLADVFGVSVDYLLRGGQSASAIVTKSINLNDYTKVKPARSKSDAAVMANYPAADAIYPLIRGKHLSLVEDIADFWISSGIFRAVDSLRDLSAYYLVEDGGGQWLVNITKDEMKSVRLAQAVGKKFTRDGSDFRRARYVLVATAQE